MILQAMECEIALNAWEKSNFSRMVVLTVIYYHGTIHKKHLKLINPGTPWKLTWNQKIGGLEFQFQC